MPFRGGVASLLKSPAVGSKQPSDISRFLAWFPPRLLRDLLRSVATCRPARKPVGPFPVDDFIRLGESRVVTLTAEFFNAFLGLDYADFSINRIVEIVVDVISTHYQKKPMRHLVKVPSGSLRLPGMIEFGGHVHHLFESFPPNASLYLRLGDLTMGPLTTLRQFQAIKSNATEGAYTLSNQLEMNGVIKAEFKLVLEINDILESKRQVVNEFAVKLQVATTDALSALLDFGAMLNLHALSGGNLTLGDLRGPCISVLLGPNRALEIARLGLKLGGDLVDVKCLSRCDSDLAEALAKALTESVGFIFHSIV